MIALYVLSLGASAAIFGLFARQVLGGQGYVPGFMQGVLLAGAVASAYAGVQLLYMALLRFIAPTRARSVPIAEGLSQLSAVVLVPHLLHVTIPWPDPILHRAGPLIYIAGFAFIHCFFKLMSFFAGVKGLPGPRLGALGWAAASALSFLAAFSGFHAWLRQSEEARPKAPESVQIYRVGDAYAPARVMPERAVLAYSFTAFPDACLTLRLANVPEVDEENPPLDDVYVAVTMEAAEGFEVTERVRLKEGWAELRVPLDAGGEGIRECRVVWSATKEPRWRRLIGIRPMVSSHRRVLLSGPFLHECRGDEADAVQRSVVLIMVDGLAAGHISGLGCKRETTPAMDRVIRHGTAYPNMFAPAPEASAGLMTALTGRNPLMHGFLGDAHGPLPEGLTTLGEVMSERHYATAAFTEGEAGGLGDLTLRSGAGRGFELFDAAYDSNAGSAATVGRARRWLEANEDVKCFLFLRLRELADLTSRERYVPGWVEGQESPRAVDLYDSALKYLDRQLGPLIKEVRDRSAQNPTCLLLTAPCGHAFSPGGGDVTPGLSEEWLRVPALFQMPGLAPGVRREPAALEDLPATLLSLAGIDPSGVIQGRSLFGTSTDPAAISMCGSPLTLSIRTEEWRYTWETGAVGRVALHRVDDLVKGRVRNVASQHPEAVGELQAQLDEYLARYAVGGGE